MTLRIATSLIAPLAALALLTPASAQQRTAAITPRPAPPAAVAAPTPAQPQVPSPEAMIILIRASLVALSQANVTNNYSVLNQLGSPTFKQANPPARLQQIFEPFRRNNIDMNPIVFVTPQLKAQPAVKDGRLRLIGYFPTAPMQVNYDMQFEPSGGNWRLFAIAVDLSQAGAPAQASQSPNQGR
ncbi:MAG: hypothetical protein ACKVOJ_08735 [Sphingomonadaceae bacterium]